MTSLAALFTLLMTSPGTEPSDASRTSRDERAVDLRWEAPAGCPDAETMRASIARSAPTAQAGVAAMHAEVVISALADHWRAALVLRGSEWTGTRSLKGPTCATVADAAGLVIVLALANEMREPEVAVAQPATPAPAPRSTPILGVAAMVDAGALPAASMGLAVSLGWRFPRAHVDLRAALFAPKKGEISTQPGTGAELSLASALAQGCYLFGSTAAAVGPCVGAGVERFGAKGFGPITAAEGSSVAPVVSAGARAEWEWARWLALFGTVELAIPVVRARFSVKDVGQVHQASPASIRGAVGLEIRFRS
jgi:hypothetical protein